ncbi:MAG TPA: TPM domain-containing protein, partial [Cellulomonadaceae bacterium]|nr:TPM domain-containing protein [Cellulomonadaceae bacterium]
MIGRRMNRLLTSFGLVALMGVLGTGTSLLVALVAATDATAAEAVAPFRVADRITDQVGALGDRTTEVRGHVDRLGADTRFDLWVVYVDSFDGANPQTWADDTATVSQLGVDDVLLAVATGERAYAFSLDTAAALTDAQIAHVRADLVEPLLARSDWAGAAIAAADGLRDAALGTGTSAGTGTSTTTGPASGSGALVVILVLVLVVLVGGVALVIRSATRRTAARLGGSGATGGSDRSGTTEHDRAGDGLATLPTGELSSRASAALVAIDDAIKASEQELGFAQAQFGLEATAAFSTALVDAKRAVADAFALRQQLDDTVPETEPQARELMTRIIRTCGEVSAALDAYADEFDTLRDLQAHASELLDDVQTRASEVVARVPAARTTL